MSKGKKILLEDKKRRKDNQGIVSAPPRFNLKKRIYFFPFGFSPAPPQPPPHTLGVAAAAGAAAAAAICSRNAGSTLSLFFLHCDRADNFS